MVSKMRFGFDSLAPVAQLPADILLMPCKTCSFPSVYLEWYQGGFPFASLPEFGRIPLYRSINNTVWWFYKIMIAVFAPHSQNPSAALNYCPNLCGVRPESVHCTYFVQFSSILRFQIAVCTECIIVHIIYNRFEQLTLHII